MDSLDSDDSSVIRCLQDYVNEITNENCKKQVGSSMWPQRMWQSEAITLPALVF